MKVSFLVLLVTFTCLNCFSQHQNFLDSAKASVKKGKAVAAEAYLTTYLHSQANISSATDTAYATALSRAGNIMLKSRYKEKALEYFLEEKKVRELNRQQNTTQYVKLNHNLGKTYYRIADFPSAQNYYVKALALAKKLEGEKTQLFCEILTDLGDLFLSKGNFLLAEKMFEKNLNICHEVYGKESKQSAGNLEKLGFITQVKGDYQAAEVYYQMSEKIYNKECGVYSVEYGNNMVLQGQLYYQLGQYTAAEALLRKAIHIFHKTDTHDTPEAVRALQKLALLNLEMNNEAQANELLSLVKNFTQEYYNEMHPEYGRALKEIGMVYLSAGYPRAAQPFLENARAIFDSILTKKHYEYTLTLSELAEVYKSYGDFSQSEELYLSAIDTFKLSMGDRSSEYAQLQARLGNLYFRMGKYEKALGMHQQAIELRKEILDNLHPDYIESTKDMSMILWAMGKNTRAESSFRKSVRNYVNQYQRYFAFLSEKEKTGFYENIQDFFTKHNNFILSRVTQNPRLLGELYNNQIATKSVLFHTSKEIRSNVFSSDSLMIEKYHRWIRYKEILAKLYKLEKDEIEKRGLLLDSLEEVSNYLEKDISLRVELSGKKNEENLLTTSWNDIRLKLHENEAAIEIVRLNQFLPESGGRYTDKVLYAALIITKNTRKHPEIVILDNGKDLEGKFLNYYRNVINLQVEDHYSFEKFWKPIKDAPALKGIKAIYLAPDGVYNQINLNTLYDPENKQYIIDQTDIHIVTNTRDIHDIKKDRPVQKNKRLSEALFIGFPDYDKQGDHDLAAEHSKAAERDAEHVHVRGGINEMFRGSGNIADLPGTKKEVESIASLFKAHNQPVEIYLGEQALEERIKDEKYFFNPPKILHIATHGFFLEDNKPATELSDNQITRSGVVDSIILNNSSDNPLLQSGVMLAGAAYAYSDETLLEEINAILEGKNYDDGILSAYEAMNLNLNETDLVVLSACETGLGVIKNGEGVYGLQRAFRTAGANSVIMSLWKVNDETTQKFMINFYENYLKSNDKRAAFRTAQIKIREEFPQPKFWGAFIMIGE